MRTIEKELRHSSLLLLINFEDRACFNSQLSSTEKFPHSPQRHVLQGSKRNVELACFYFAVIFVLVLFLKPPLSLVLPSFLCSITFLINFFILLHFYSSRFLQLYQISETCVFLRAQKHTNIANYKNGYPLF